QDAQRAPDHADDEARHRLTASLRLNKPAATATTATETRTPSTRLTASPPVLRAETPCLGQDATEHQPSSSPRAPASGRDYWGEPPVATPSGHPQAPRQAHRNS